MNSVIYLDYKSFIESQRFIEDEVNLYTLHLSRNNGVEVLKGYVYGKNNFIFVKYDNESMRLVSPSELKKFLKKANVELDSESLFMEQRKQSLIFHYCLQYFLKNQISKNTKLEYTTEINTEQIFDSIYDKFGPVGLVLFKRHIYKEIKQNIINDFLASSAFNDVLLRKRGDEFER